MRERGEGKDGMLDVREEGDVGAMDGREGEKKYD